MRSSLASLCLHPRLGAADVAFLRLAIVRCALKLVLNLAHVDAMAKHCRPGGCLHRPGVAHAERFLVMRMAC